MTQPLKFAAWVVIGASLSVTLFTGAAWANGGMAPIPLIVIVLLVLPGLITFIGALHTKRPTWLIAIAPVLVSVCTFTAVATFWIMHADRPFD